MNGSEECQCCSSELDDKGMHALQNHTAKFSELWIFASQRTQA